MSLGEGSFVACTPLVEGVASERCRAIVVIPARNEEDSLAATLDALLAQRDLGGEPLDPACFEVLLLLNNCTDRSAARAHAWQTAHRAFPLHITQRTLPPQEAHVGKARRMLMDTAWARLRGHSGDCGILSTDSDTEVAADWIAQNLRALAEGADAVGGVIELAPGELESLPLGARRAYRQDREYQWLRAELEYLLDPQMGDPWPRHLEHFGASLACTPAMYERVGGLPAVNSLEDLAFVDALYRADARLRHDLRVRVYTSARLKGRATRGLSSQLRTWQSRADAGKPHLVPGAHFLEHRFRSLRTLRDVHRGRVALATCGFPSAWQVRIAAALAEGLSTGEFLGRIDCNAWIDESYGKRSREAEICSVNRDLRLSIARTRADPSATRRVMMADAAADRADSVLADAR